MRPCAGPRPGGRARPRRPAGPPTPRCPKVADGLVDRAGRAGPRDRLPDGRRRRPGRHDLPRPGPDGHARPADASRSTRSSRSRDGKVTTFADRLWSVMGLEWVDGTLYVVHAPFLSAFRDTDGDGKADRRVDLITGPRARSSRASTGSTTTSPRASGSGWTGSSTSPSATRASPAGVGRDGTTITMSGGGVIRVRPDGTGLEVVSTGERNPLSVALTAADDVFTYGNDDDSKKWPNSLTHHIVGGHYGYPYEFLTAPGRALPIVAGQLGGVGRPGDLLQRGRPARPLPGQPVLLRLGPPDRLPLRGRAERRDVPGRRDASRWSRRGTSPTSARSRSPSAPTGRRSTWSTGPSTAGSPTARRPAGSTG